MNSSAHVQIIQLEQTKVNANAKINSISLLMMIKASVVKAAAVYQLILNRQICAHVQKMQYQFQIKSAIAKKISKK